ncbi:MAG: hypothetical protein CM15mP70_08240 [Pelagibacteraceae bacterium]|nr:MAG: hypothetical protein CM15mP70_08240 [Pelagibacteraceae bacterium]
MKMSEDEKQTKNNFYPFTENTKSRCNKKRPSFIDTNCKRERGNKGAQ